METIKHEQVDQTVEKEQLLESAIVVYFRVFLLATYFIVPLHCIDIMVVEINKGPVSIM